MDKLFSFVDLDRNIVSDEDRETVYKQLEEIGLSPDTAVILFESQNNTLAKVPLNTDSNLPKTLLIKPASGAVKVNHSHCFIMAQSVMEIFFILADTLGQHKPVREFPVSSLLPDMPEVASPRQVPAVHHGHGVLPVAGRHGHRGLHPDQPHAGGNDGFCCQCPRCRIKQSYFER